MKRKFDVALFDLDGTLTNSGPGVTGCVRRTLEHLGRPALPPDTLRRFVGPPMFDSFTAFCGMNPEEAENAIRYFRDLYRESGVYDNSVYPGIPEALQSLREAGMRLAVATSKPRSMTDVVLGHFGLRRYFDFVAAADESDKGSGKEKLIFSVLKESGCAPERAVMIGDTKFDAAGARRAGVHFLGVLFGFGTEEELRRAGAGQLAAAPEEIARRLLDKP